MSGNINLENMLRIGTMLRGVYRVDSYLSSGGFGNTYAVTNVEFDEQYAIKEFFMSGVSERDANATTVSVSNSQNVAAFASQLSKFKKEARRLRKLHSPYIVRVYDLFEENGTAYYVMDYIDGESLSERLKRTGRPLAEAEVMRMLRQILSALDTAHSAGILHLDLKPANIMADRRGNVTLIDFGASKQRSATEGVSTSSSGVAYTNGYAPREQMEQNLDKFGPWTDFYALGATLYTLLTTKKPPLPSDIDDDRTADKHIALPMPPSVSAETRGLVLWMMSPGRTARPQSVAEIRSRIAGDDTTTVVETGTDGSTAGGQPPVEPPGQPTAKPRASRQRSHVIIAAAVVAGMALSLFFGARGCHGDNAATADSVAIDSAADGSNYLQRVDIEVEQGKCQYSGYVNGEGIPDGEGEAWFDDGRYYKGNFSDGKMVDDDAFFRFDNGDTFKGKFVDDHFSYGVYTVKQDGSYFKGSFDADGQPLRGSWYDKNGERVEDVPGPVTLKMSRDQVQ